MLRTLTTTVLLGLATATAASAMQAQDLDINGDRFATIDEVRQIFPGFTGSDFRRLDINDDRRLSSNELQSPEATGVVARYRATSTVANGLSDIDQNGDRFASKAELAAVYTGLSDSDFRRIDGNRDSRVSAVELYAPGAQGLVARYRQGDDPLVTIMDVDADDDFFASFDELQAQFPGLDRLDFEDIDLNDDNRVAATEFYAPEAQSILSRK